MIKIVFFDFSRTVGKDSGFGAGPYFMKKGDKYENLYQKFKNHKLSEKEYVKSVVKLWKGIRKDDLSKIYPTIRLNPHIKETLKKIKKMKIKSALISNMPLQLAEFYRRMGFDFIFGTECEIRTNAFTGRVVKISKNKGAVVRNLCRKLKIAPNKSLAIGDSLADIPMFNVVGYNNAVAYNANEEVQKYAKYHITDFKELIPIVESIK